VFGQTSEAKVSNKFVLICHCTHVNSIRPTWDLNIKIELFLYWWSDRHIKFLLLWHSTGTQYCYLCSLILTFCVYCEKNHKGFYSTL